VANSLSSGQYDLVLSFSDGWKELKGAYIDGEGQADFSRQDKWDFELKADTEGFDNSCTE
jgi:hypothetical protein